MTPPPPRRARAGAASGRSAGSLDWRGATAAPLVLVTGPESLLADRAIAQVVRSARAARAQAVPKEEVEVSDLDARSYAPGSLAVLVSPSLFEEHRVVVLRNLHDGTEEAVDDVLQYLADPQEDVVLVVHHAGGARARKVLDAARSAGAVLVDCPSVKKDTERLEFVRGEFAAADRRIETGAAQALVDAFGSDLRELASACGQLLSDTAGSVGKATVARYYRGRAEANGFEVADAVAARQPDEALLQLRRALDSGVDPVPLVAVIAMKLRGLAKVAAARGRGAAVAQELGMAPWMVDKARRDLAAWDPIELSEAIIAAAAADTALKGGTLRGGVPHGRSADHVYTMEKLILGMVR